MEKSELLHLIHTLWVTSISVEEKNHEKTYQQESVDQLDLHPTEEQNMGYMGDLDRYDI